MPAPQAPPTSRTRSWARAGLAPYLVVLALIVWLPAQESSRVTGVVGWAAEALGAWGLPVGATATVLEVLANVVLFVPFGVLVAAGWPAVSRWRVIALGAATSMLIELVQLALPTRFTTLSDVLANTAGMALGWWVVHTVRSRAARPVTS